MNRRHRALAAFLAAFALLFAQFAVSAHACVPYEKPGKSQVMAHHEGCVGTMDREEAPADRNVCAGHCQYGNVSVDEAQSVPAVVDAVGPALRVDVSAVAGDSAASSSRRVEPTAAPPPPAILFGVLRI